MMTDIPVRIQKEALELILLLWLSEPPGRLPLAPPGTVPWEKLPLFPPGLVPLPEELLFPEKPSGIEPPGIEPPGTVLSEELFEELSLSLRPPEVLIPFMPPLEPPMEPMSDRFRSPVSTAVLSPLN